MKKIIVTFLMLISFTISTYSQTFVDFGIGGFIPTEKGINNLANLQIRAGGYVSPRVGIGVEGNFSFGDDEGYSENQNSIGVVALLSTLSTNTMETDLNVGVSYSWYNYEDYYETVQYIAPKIGYDIMFNLPNSDFQFGIEPSYHYFFATKEGYKNFGAFYLTAKFKINI